MPTVHDGIGTWYYGKRRIHRFKSTCSFCQRVGELQSYDTTLYFVVFMVPIIPLSRKRILQQCPSCSRHRVISLKKWEEGKASDTALLLEKLKANPDDRATILEGLALAISYQDAGLFDQLAESLAGHRRDDAAIQTQLGGGYSYFSRYAEAEDAFRAALAVEDKPEVRESLAHVLLKQHRPEEAAPYLVHILTQKQVAGIGMIFLLIEGYQQEGMHEQALAVIERRDKTFPEFADDKTYRKQRKLSERYQHSGKKIKSAYLSESGKTGYREGGWTALLPRVVAPIIILGLLCWYLIAAYTMGQSRKVYLVNGAGKPYQVAVNGREWSLRPGQATAIHIPEGTVNLEFRDPHLAASTLICEVQTSFLTRPFSRPTFVINPDQLAVLVWQEAVYAETATPPRRQPQLHLGETLYTFKGIDYEFAPFPQTLTLKGKEVTKTRISLPPITNWRQRLQVIGQLRDGPQSREYARRWLQFDPDDVVALSWLLSQLEAEEALRFLRLRLNERPLLVEWHRLYQSTMERLHPEHDLIPEYRKLVAETNREPDALYLLGRVEGAGKGEELVRQAATAKPPSAYALYSLGFRALAQGQYPEAVKWTEKAIELAPNNLLSRHYDAALFAAGQYDRLLDHLKPRPGDVEENLQVLMQRLQVLAAKGDRDKARATIEQAVQSISGPDAQAERPVVRAGMEMVLSCCTNDVQGFLKQAAQIPNMPPFEPLLLRGKLEEAATKIIEANADQAALQHALVYLAALKAKKAKLAEQEWQKFLSALAKGDREERRFAAMLATGKAPDLEQVRQAPIDPDIKRVAIAAAAAHSPDRTKELRELAQKLDFQRDLTSLCLWAVQN
ncbi:MAG TPA: tetratricopeptide repeat protein [Gemmataceae bacterium]|jgi:tetratricopeptide (TPR) repeat protein|nr:tetratricopeptide repeat protein [Gemmataceae bacterium]